MLDTRTKHGENPALDEVCEFIVDCLHKTAPTQSTGYPSIRTPNVGRGRLMLEGVNRVSEDVYAEWTKRAIPEPCDLIMAREAPAGNVAIIGEGQTVCLGQRTVHLRPDHEKVDPDFLCYYLLAPRQQGALLAGETGATARHVNMRDIRRLKLGPLPTLSMQRELGQILAAYDDLIENNRRRIALLAAAARLLFREWFIHFRFPGHEHFKIIDSLPEGWERRTLGSVINLQRGFDLPVNRRVAGEVPVYGSTGIVGEHNVAKVDSPTLVTGRSGSLGRVRFVDEPCWPLNTSLWVTDFKAVSIYFAYFMLSEMDLAKFNTGASVPTLDRKVAHAANVIVPTRNIGTLFDEQMEILFMQKKLLDQQNQRLAQARDLLLPRLMNGEIVV